MFGYVRPLKGEMKCKDFDLYQATYCGLCRNLRRRYGVIAPMFLNYDFTFLALLLWSAEERPKTCSGRCHANLLCKKTMCDDSEALDIATDESVILAYWKLCDAVSDDSFVRGLSSRMLSWILYPNYRKAARHRPDFDRVVQLCLAELSALETEQSASIDRTADTFARILRASMPETDDVVQNRALGELLYHIGRWIYLIDARDDLDEDIAQGNYNPLMLRYGPKGDDESLEATLNHSLNLARSAFQLGSFGCRQPIIENILFGGLPVVQRAVFEGSYKELKKQKLWRS